MSGPVHVAAEGRVSRVALRHIHWSGRARESLIGRLWLFLFPLLFLPNLGLSSTSAYGVLEFSDYLIIPYLACLWAGKSRGGARTLDKLGAVLLVFLAWAFLSTVTINLRYDYGSDTRALYFGLAKLAKLTLYGAAGILMATRVRDARSRREFHWSVLGAIAILAVSLVLGPGKQALPEAARMGYKAINSISVTVAIMSCYAGALLASGYGSRGWRRAAAFAVGLALVGCFVSGGRGGWVAAAVAALYLLRRRGLGSAGIGLAAGFLIVGYISYSIFPEFRQRLDWTLSPDPGYLAKYDAGVVGFDEGGRAGIWLSSLPRVLDAPLLGTGFYHRGGPTNLPWSGSHNFFIQMFLETGIVGGLLILAIFGRMWRDAGSPVARTTRLDLALRSALIAAVAGGMGGEYFYGGIGLLSVFVAYAAVGGLPVTRRVRLRSYSFRGTSRSVAAKVAV